MSRVRRGLLAIVVVAAAALSAGGCAAKAKAVVEPGPLELDAPAPPPRVIVPPDPEVPVPPPQPSGADPVTPKAPRKPASAAPARVEPRSESVRPALPPPAPPGLEQALPSSPSDIVRQVREQLNLAQRDLDRVDYVGLTADRRSQYDTAKRFIAQAEQALREKNLVFASRVAEKAAGLAASLAGRLAP